MSGKFSKVSVVRIIRLQFIRFDPRFAADDAIKTIDVVESWRHVEPPLAVQDGPNEVLVDIGRKLLVPPVNGPIGTIHGLEAALKRAPASAT